MWWLYIILCRVLITAEPRTSGCWAGEQCASIRWLNERHMRGWSIAYCNITRTHVHYLHLFCWVLVRVIELPGHFSEGTKSCFVNLHFNNDILDLCITNTGIRVEVTHTQFFRRISEKYQAVSQVFLFFRGNSIFPRHPNTWDSAFRPNKEHTLNTTCHEVFWMYTRMYQEITKG